MDNDSNTPAPRPGVTGTNDAAPDAPAAMFTGMPGGGVITIPGLAVPKYPPAFVLSLVVACLTEFFFCYRGEHPLHADMGLQIANSFGYAFSSAFMLWQLFHFIFWRVYFPGRKAATALALLLAGFAGAMTGWAVQERAYQQEVAVSRRLGAMLNEQPDAGETPAREAGSGGPADARAAGEPGAPERVAAMEGIVREWVAAAKDLRQQYVRDLEASGWESILDAGRLERETDFSESRAIIARARAVAAAQPGKYRALAAKYTGPLHAVAEQKKEGWQLARELERRLPKDMENAERLFDHELLIIEGSERVILFLEKTRGTWKIRDDNVVFRNDADAAAYNAEMEALQRAIRDQEDFERYVMGNRDQ